MRTIATDKGLELRADVDDDVPPGDLRRRQPAPSDPPQPPRQRGQVHGRGVGRARRRAQPSARRTTVEHPHPRTRHGHRDPAGQHAPAVRLVQPGRCLDLSALWRHGARARDLEAARRADGRHDVGRERRRGTRELVPPDTDRARRFRRRRAERRTPTRSRSISIPSRPAGTHCASSSRRTTS